MLVWIDCEMTGLDLAHDGLIEVAALVTDGQLNVQGEGVDVIIKPEPQWLDHMNDFVRDMHTRSGLLAELPHGKTMAEAQALVLALHELATNAMKHGALTQPDGLVTVACAAWHRKIVRSVPKSGETARPISPASLPTNSVERSIDTSRTSPPSSASSRPGRSVTSAVPSGSSSHPRSASTRGPCRSSSRCSPSSPSARWA